MSKKIILSATLPVMTFLMAHAQEPIIMTVAGEDVPVSEFEYLYNKNNQQQLVPQSLDEYVEMFKIYKMKVADAKSLGIDTTAAFKKEIAQYRRELASPYIADSLFINDLIAKSYDRAQQDVEVSMIRLGKSRNPEENNRIKLLADSLQGVLASGEDFATIARNYSNDVAAERGGEHGYMTFGRLPYLFEEALYSTPEGKVSEVVELPDGYYIVKPGHHRNSVGRIEAAHILKLVPPNASEEDNNKIFHQIDSLYNVVNINTELFADLAKQYSDDKGSARNGGLLPVFSVGEMVPELESVAFELKDGEISQTFKTRYGLHIVKKISSKGSPDYQEVKSNILQRLSNPQDDRFRVVKQHEIDRLLAKHNGTIDNEVFDKMKISAKENGIDSLYLANWTTLPLSNTTVARVNNQAITAGDIASQLYVQGPITAEAAPLVLERVTNYLMQNLAMEAEEQYLYDNESDYRNLLDEYTDGSLLYEISLQKVWDKGAKDKEGLEEFFAANRDMFKWEKPHAKGILVQSLNDSVSNQIKERLNGAKGDIQKLNSIRKDFTGKATIETVVVEQGVNPMVDHLVFGGEQSKPRLVNFTDYFIFEPRIITEPEEAADVRGEAISAYQNYLEQIWIEELKMKYPAVVNNNVVNNLR